MRILVVEDDLALCDALVFHLKYEGYDVDACHDGEEALYNMLQQAHDLVILDRMLPGLDGISVLSSARSKGFCAPVLMLTALGGLGDRVSGLDAGADDYMVKPFAAEELLARVRAMVRRPAQWINNSNVACADLTLDTTSLAVVGPSGALELTKREARLLEVLMRNQNQTFPREVLFAKVWGTDALVEDGNLDSYVHFLRKRLNTVGSCVKIATVRGVGFRLEVL
jgi:DNA-binding response OmpR family regulator